MSSFSTIQFVSEVTRASKRFEEVSVSKTFEILAGRRPEACSEPHGSVIASEFHPFVGAVSSAFSSHHPLVLSPDMFWLLIVQGLAQHVNSNSELLRQRFVQHDGKQRLHVQRDDFIKGSPDNPWNEIFEEFSVQIREHIGEENHSSILATFSTTGMIEKAANEIALMNTVSSYFDYEVNTFCGIPEVKLEGNAKDWAELAVRAEDIGKQYDLAWWTDRIVPILKRIARNAAGADDPELWRNIYKQDEQSGGIRINGWVVNFFPYLGEEDFTQVRKEEVLESKSGDVFSSLGMKYVKVSRRNHTFDRENHIGIHLGSIPDGLSTVPFRWQYLDHDYEMDFVAGFIAYSQNPKDFSVRPMIGWAVCEK